MANSTDKSILTAAGKALLAQLNAEEKALVIDKMIFANVPNRPEYPQPDDVVPTDNIVHQEQVEQRGRLSADSVIYSTTLTSDVGPFDFNWTGAYCSEYGVLVTIDHHALTPKTADEPGVAGNTLVRSVVLEYKDIAEITNITVDASSWQYNATERMKKMDSDVAQSIIDQNGKDWFIEDGFLVTPSGSAYNIKAGAGYVSGNRVSMEFDRSVQVPNKPSFIYIDAHREGTPTGEQVTLFDFVITAEEKDDYIDSSTGKDIPHFVCKIAEVLADGSVSDLRPEGESATKSFVAKVAGLPWVQGENETKSTQKRTYIGPGAVPVSVVCPEASVANPVEMGEIPDTKWHVVSDKKSKIAAVGVTLTKGQRWVNVSGTDFPMSTPIASDKVVTAINITVKPFTITFPDETKFLLNPERFSPSKISILSYWADPKRKDNSDSFVQAFTDSGVLKQPIYIEGTGGYDNPYVIKQQVHTTVMGYGEMVWGPLPLNLTTLVFKYCESKKKILVKSETFTGEA
ncbi:probable tail fiber protein [Vibrio sp. JCM 19053]|nr:probable tail fiber protein [Vibrio sp. JCM 19053]